ncbi:MAG: DUF2065 domain-containing protein [Candidatus Accumulibacter sp.]|jgi:uncharacterized protein YjeT (DUF2065 family)|nr:DUF2065 domain-containing protein [Accumulibacter sp.]
MTDILIPAFALMLIMEGLLPFIAPALWRDTFRRMIQFTDGQLRFTGLALILAGMISLMIFQ